MRKWAFEEISELLSKICKRLMKTTFAVIKKKKNKTKQTKKSLCAILFMCLGKREYSIFIIKIK